MLMSNERPVLVFVNKRLSLRDREVKVTVFRNVHIALILGGSGTGQVQLWLVSIKFFTCSVEVTGPRSTQNLSQSWVWRAGKH